MSAAFYDLLKYAKTGIASSDMTAYDKMRALAMAGGKVKTLTGVPPLSFKSNGKPLVSWSMLGNTQQSGTPAPDAPIMPQLVGERTGNLFDLDSYFTNSKVTRGTITKNDTGLTLLCTDNYGDPFVNNVVFKGQTMPSEYRATLIDVSGNTEYTLHLSAAPKCYISFINSSYVSISSVGVIESSDPVDYTFTTPSNTRYIQIRLGANIQSGQSVTFNNIMLTEGSTPPDHYEPYGYKIPITCAGQTVPIYLGQTQTVRRIKKLVLTGEEFWSSQHLNVRLFALEINDYLRIPAVTSICTHYRAISNVDGWASVSENRCVCFYRGTSANNILYIRDMAHATVDAFKTFLQQQYAAGTPVTIWYVLAEPETTIINEPLAKIGTYADELHSTDAGVSIPTAKGQNTLTVDTDLKPSSMTITYRG